MSSRIKAATTPMRARHCLLPAFFFALLVATFFRTLLIEFQIPSSEIETTSFNISCPCVPPATHAIRDVADYYSPCDEHAIHNTIRRAHCVPHGELPSGYYDASDPGVLKYSQEPIEFPPHRIRPFLFYMQAMPPFKDYIIALASPEQDPLSARLMHETNAREWHVESAYAQALHEECLIGGLVLDCGANVGQTMALAASLGCHVVGYELQPRLHVLLKLTAIANGWENRWTVRSGVSYKENDIISGPLRYTTLGTVDDFAEPTGFLTSSESDCELASDPYCFKDIKLSNILDDFTSDVSLVKLDVDGIELLLMNALMDKMKGSRLHIKNFIVEGNNLANLTPKKNPIYRLCAEMQYHPFLLDGPDFFTGLENLVVEVKNSGYISRAFYVADCENVAKLIQGIGERFGGSFSGNWWLTSEEKHLKLLML
jgi:FkbM family methyltransferase